MLTLRTGPGRGDAGASAVEYAALVVLATVILGGLIAIGVSGRAQHAVARALCEIVTGFRGPCEAAQRRHIPYQCTANTADTRLQLYGSVRIFSAGVGTTDGVSTTVDPNSGRRSAEVSMGSGGEFDVGGSSGRKRRTEADKRAGTPRSGGSRIDRRRLRGMLRKTGRDLPAVIKRQLRKAASVTGKVGVQAGVQYLYDFNDPNAARRFLADQRGDDIDRYSALPGAGPIFSVVDDGHNPVKWLVDKIRGKRRHNRKPTGVRITVDDKAEAHAGSRKAGGSGGARAEIDVDTELTARPGRGYEVSRTFTGSFGANANLRKLAPLLGDQFTPGAGFTGSLGFTARFDKDGNPTRFVFTTEHREQAGSQVPGGHDTTVQTVHVLDLRDPQNANAVLAALPDLTGPAGGGLLPPLATLADRRQGGLMDRLANDSYEVRSTYDTVHRERDKRLVAVGRRRETESRRLTSARGIDHTDPDGRWQSLTRCLAN